jgi:threonine aldolase
MYSFKNDYNQTCHPNILKELKNLENIQFDGYGLDDICDKAKEKIRKEIENDSDIHFIAGGTLTNLIVISSILRPYEAVISCDSGHINVHETGAIEAVGHKIITLKNDDGKLNANEVKKVFENHFNDENAEHTVKPKMVYISNPTEIGSIYTKKELKELYDVCKEYDAYLYLDGARLAYSFEAVNNDVYLKDYKNLVDVYYIGGTKCGALFGEALVINNEKLIKDFRYNIKQRGGMLAKGFILGSQFNTLFSNNLYYEIGKYANDIAAYLSEELEKRNIKMLSKRVSNQLFLILDNKTITELRKNYSFEKWQVIDDNNTAIRLCISWATDKDKVYEFLEDLDKIL